MLFLSAFHNQGGNVYCTFSVLLSAHKSDNVAGALHHYFFVVCHLTFTDMFICLVNNVCQFQTQHYLGFYHLMLFRFHQRAKNKK